MIIWIIWINFKWIQIKIWNAEILKCLREMLKHLRETLKNHEVLAETLAQVLDLTLNKYVWMSLSGVPFVIPFRFMCEMFYFLCFLFFLLFVLRFLFFKPFKPFWNCINFVVIYFLNFLVYVCQLIGTNYAFWSIASPFIEDHNSII